jgi:hypothetical protein
VYSTYYGNKGNDGNDEVEIRETRPQIRVFYYTIPMFYYSVYYPTTATTTKRVEIKNKGDEGRGSKRSPRYVHIYIYLILY